MATTKQTYDVFLSNASADLEFAEELAGRLKSVGLHAFYDVSQTAGQDLSSAIWDALAESRALIALIPPDARLQAMGMVEIGAATAWNKPVYLVLSEPSTRLPDALKSYQTYPRSRLDEVIQRIRTEFEPLTDDDREVLEATYKDVNVPADQLSQSPKSLRKLTTEFNRKARKDLSGERLLSELVRLRKKGTLPRIRRSAV